MEHVEHAAVPWVSAGPEALDGALFCSLSIRTVDDERVRIDWSCPRCFHANSEHIAQDGHWFGLSGSQGQVAEEVPIKCECTLGHEGRPEGEVGCGYRRVVDLGLEE